MIFRLICFTTYDSLFHYPHLPYFSKTKISGGKMERKGSIRVILLLLFYVVLSLYSIPGWSAEEARKQPALTSSDCVKCHEKQPAEIDAQGGRHKTITCQDCHSGHRPTSKNNIPLCNQCHQGQPHFDLKGCLTCHKNPHTPLSITFTSTLTDPCLTCHKPQIQQLRENKSKHTALYCTTCHSVHRKKPECTQCHKPHSADMGAQDCKKCHKAHMPKVVRYADDTSSKLCAACHANAFTLLTASKARHSTFACAFCHKEKHKMIPKCQDCHGAKHPASIMAKFPRCGDCHKIAHDLNNWSSTAAPKADALKVKKKKKQ
jgi:predicted CXXCH cytochrome family protein